MRMSALPPTTIPPPYPTGQRESPPEVPEVLFQKKIIKVNSEGYKTPESLSRNCVEGQGRTEHGQFGIPKHAHGTAAGNDAGQAVTKENSLVDCCASLPDQQTSRYRQKGVKYRVAEESARHNLNLARTEADCPARIVLRESRWKFSRQTRAIRCCSHNCEEKVSSKRGRGKE